MRNSYVRVIPRDLFNEANLLKCLGQLCLKLDTAGEHRAEMIGPHPGERFEIEQNPDSGGISAGNVVLIVGGERCMMERPLNSRRPWPLYVTHVGIAEEYEPIEVFTDEGELTPDFLALIRPSE